MTTADSPTGFRDARGETVEATLTLPQGAARAHALLPHAFAPGPDAADALIARALAERGIAVLRWRCRAAEGEDAVGDLMAAAACLRDTGSGPALLVGHDRGGSAALRAAARIPEVRAVITIAAPAPEHHEAVVVPLLILHSPADSEVPVTQARTIFRAARHPKSFVALDGAAHALTDPADACYAAGLIAAWAPRHVVDPAAEQARREPTPAPPPEGSVLVEETGRGRFQQRVRAGRHELVADEPPPAGADTGPSPYDLLLAALGTCTAMTLRMYAERKNWPLRGVRVALTHSRIHPRDCANCETAEGKVDRIERTVALDGDLDDEQRARLLEIADKCPVHRTLRSETIIDTEAADAGLGG